MITLKSAREIEIMARAGRIVAVGAIARAAAAVGVGCLTGLGVARGCSSATGFGTTTRLPGKSSRYTPAE